MSIILGEDGEPISDGSCPECTSKDIQKITPGFGRYGKTVCLNCGHVIAEGKEAV